MKTFASVLVASFAALAQAVKLTNSNYDVAAGQPFTITWSDAQGPVTLTLKNGPSTNLATVQSIATGQSGTSFVWTPPTTLPSDQYAIEISDGTGTPNYSEQFSLATDVSASASASASATASASASAATSASGTTTASPSITSSGSSSSASAESSSAVSSAANSTATTVSTSTTHASTRHSSTSEPTTAPTTVPGSDSVRLGSPIALIGLTVAAMLYFQ
ncbi:Ser-Thr-rich glycosyl-phosphatidyl-inositol-anchored membrane family-domain-containing protein [Colletotrichum navitas]|uniref:Ser-Thr-rich glycosyl-phosphatidyl-inositol-anchored membrane family-domain-containing protein n=1 Tax=Colletotrichum navitas TaxID=681940 RepID=A0AAD8QDA9_9PEZI|nr:Ser-Thr-rich glycosyl-phosphatidyl-inositol-anchored membrane family-domain-containing protein [Colletotrichum navitas]KAK1600465.1 Ser-Thr-rich glycosyl-phosphatidyl-inositol-anchored membrane family-domain-containing protein [Colletotrichum navitas]